MAVTREQILKEIENKKDFTVREIYFILNRIYATPYPDNLQEENESIEHLKDQFRPLSSKEQDDLFLLMVHKMFDMTEASGNFKSKLNRCILTNFWEKEFKVKIVLPKAPKNQI
jgi:hypothetical protein